MTEILLLNAVIFLGAFVQGLIGFGLGVVCAPLIFLVEPGYLPAPLILLSTLLTSVILVANRADLSFRLVRWPIVGQAFGVVSAALIMAVINEAMFGLVFALLLLLAVVLTVLRLRLPINVLTGSVCGYIAGLSGTVVAVGGPPVALLFHSLSPRQTLANLSTFFLVGCLMSLAALFLIGRLTWQEVLLAVQLLPGLVAGFYASHFAGFLRQPKIVKGATVLFSGLMAVYLLAKYSLQLLA
ncbi:sulfite exporter TauE/SafE family protein [Halioxenophilus sp. WMMB6]|uniref:sulfite exporter TauE/SafE family protein n=1 Tax=Halioxenophilus sp. WMMB6 TaxID=3073815 RepID=UPI00295E4760|nr:sulfite exporter TauE/SafE family protein [Halioxenophilus sp. WMMB6]